MQRQQPTSTNVAESQQGDSHLLPLEASPVPSFTRKLEWWRGFFTYFLYHCVVFPVLLARFSGRIKRLSWEVAKTRFLGGSSPPHRASWTLVLASGIGETRTGIQIAEEIAADNDVSIAVLTQMPRLQRTLIPSESTFPFGFSPFNSPQAALIALWRWKPKRIIFVELPRNFYLAFFAKVFGVETVLMNAKLSMNQQTQLSRKALGRWQFSLIDTFFVQAPVHLQRLAALGAPEERIRVAGVPFSPAEYLASMGASPHKKWSGLLRLSADIPVILAGSTYPAEEEVLLQAFHLVLKTEPKAILILAPRRLDRKEGDDCSLKIQNRDFDRRSWLERHDRTASIVLFDTVGELKEVYAVATVAHIGGTIRTQIGGHTPLEALAWGLPMTLGPEFGQQEGTVDLVVRQGFAVVCTDAEQLSAAWLEAIRSPERRQQLQKRAAEMTNDWGAIHAKAFRALKA